jgi:hypothetical protein
MENVDTMFSFFSHITKKGVVKNARSTRLWLVAFAQGLKRISVAVGYQLYDISVKETFFNL